MQHDLCLVIGGSGFVGQHLVQQLLAAGYTVRVFDRQPLYALPVEFILGDLRDRSAVQRACAGVGTVFHSASMVDWRAGNREVLYAINVQGTRHVIDACCAQPGTRLIYTSSIDVVFDGSPIRAGDERLPYARRHLDDYGQTKMLAEQAVLAAHGQNGLTTCALRLAGVYGPGDVYRLPTIVAMARQGRMLRIGDGRARFNHVYVENAAHAHLCAAERLGTGSPLAGKPYFIIDHPAHNFFDFVESFPRAMGLPTAQRAIPFPIAYILAILMEGWAQLRRSRAIALTRYIVTSTCRDFYFNGSNAARDLAYTPPISEREAFQRTLAWLQADTSG
ncbi:NAD-dependent epimerase/dehydratase family protein [Candidatus Viridilinea mediisalina]|uniref:3-beta hydroxysteroid dehydrogenase n=1 Tax=Candidatus Viridilinea mediisalina TaxID=2024553 RepID=A0A2A6RN78_9CHLR|nr:NAD-dependent epimerase/dehydratase family protein [Candidatus Viridilinea mediisalina]PDW04403.1 3-beta hydroxysteroid dehydrogenase [Candidatus Viridilinea mediisalina]